MHKVFEHVADGIERHHEDVLKLLQVDFCRLTSRKANLYDLLNSPLVSNQESAKMAPPATPGGSDEVWMKRVDALFNVGKIPRFQNENASLTTTIQNLAFQAKVIYLMGLRSEYDRCVILWEPPRSEAVNAPTLVGLRFDSNPFSPDGQLLLTSSRGTTKIWDASEGNLIRVLDVRSHDAKFSIDGKWILSHSSKAVRVWSVANGSQLLKLDHPRRVAGTAFSSDGWQVVANSRWGMSQVWNAVDGRQLYEFSGSGNAAFSQDDTRIVDSEGNVFDSATGRPLFSLVGSARPVASSMSPDARQIVTIEGRTAHVSALFDGRRLFGLSGHTRRLRSAAFSPDGHLIVTSSLDGTIRLWDASDGVQRVVLKGNWMWSVSHAKFSSDGKQIVAWCPQSVRVHSAADGSMRSEVKEHMDFIRSASFSPDGRHVLIQFLNKPARIVNALDGRLVVELKA